MNESLLRILGLIGGHLAPRTRPSFLSLLPAGHAEAVEAFVKRTEAGEEGGQSALEERLLAQFDAPPQDEEEDEEEELEWTSEGESQEDAEEEEVAAVEEEVAAAVEEEPGLPVLLALLSVAAAPEAAADFLVRLPLHLQGQVALTIATGTLLNITRNLPAAEVELVEELRQVLSDKEEWGTETACRILRAIPESRQLRRIITAADEIEPETVILLQNHLFVFEDLLQLSDRDLQILLMQVDNTTLAQALQMTEDKVENRLLRNVSSRRRGMIVEEEERYARATLAEIELAQLQVLDAARRLYEQEKISTYFGSVERKRRPTLVAAEEEDQVAGEDSEEEREPEKRKRNLLPLGIALVGIVLTAVWFLSREGTDPSRSISPSASQKMAKRARAGKKGPMRVGVQGEGETPSGEKRGRTPVSKQANLEPGGSMKTPDGVRALLELPGVARFELDESAEVERPLEEGSEETDELFLRIGRVRTVVLEQGFAIRTPVVEVKGRPGTVFRTRVVLDATTTVEVEKGRVEVVSLVEDGRRWLLQRGTRGRFASRGGGTIEPLED